MKGRGGSAALAAMLKQRTETVAPPEIVQKSMESSPATPASPPPAPPAPPSIAPPPPRAVSPVPPQPTSPKPPVSPTPPPPVPAARPAAPPAPVSPAAPAAPSSTYLPKTTSFSGANKCYVCDKTVYKMEEIIALGHVWHDKCFRCGGKQPLGENPGCNKVLTRDGYLDHHSEPFCNACYNKLYRPKGFGYGNTLNTDYGATTPPPPAPAVPAPAAPPAPVAPPAKPSAPLAAPPAKPTASPVKAAGGSASLAAMLKQRTETAPPEIVQKSINSTPPPAAAPAPPAPAAPFSKPAPPVPTQKPAAPAPKYTPTNDTTTNANTAPKCTSCAKTVYKMEEMIAVGRVWHLTCFCCGGTKGDGCNKVLKRDNYLDHDNQPYCNPCYNKLYRPKGFGYGNTLSTDYGPTQDNTAQVTEGVADMSTSAPPAPPAPSRPAPPSNPNPTLTMPVVPSDSLKKAASINIGASSKALKDTTLHKEASYVGDNDEVDESEW